MPCRFLIASVLFWPQLRKVDKEICLAGIDIGFWAAIGEPFSFNLFRMEDQYRIMLIGEPVSSYICLVAASAKKIIPTG